MSQPKKVPSRNETTFVDSVDEEKEGAPVLETPEEPRSIPDEVPEDDVPELEIPEVPVMMGTAKKPGARTVDLNTPTIAPTLNAITTVLASRGGTVSGTPVNVPMSADEAAQMAAQHNL